MEADFIDLTINCLIVELKNKIRICSKLHTLFASRTLFYQIVIII